MGAQRTAPSRDRSTWREQAAGLAASTSEPMPLSMRARARDEGLVFEVAAGNRTFDNPTLVTTAGAAVRVALANALPEPTVVHWHGLTMDTRNDGNGETLIAPGERYRLRVRRAQSRRPVLVPPASARRDGEPDRIAASSVSSRSTTTTSASLRRALDLDARRHRAHAGAAGSPRRRRRSLRARPGGRTARLVRVPAARQRRAAPVSTTSRHAAIGCACSTRRMRARIGSRFVATTPPRCPSS